MSWICLTLLSFSVIGPEATVRASGQGELRGRLAALGAERVQLQTEQGPLDLPADEVDAIEFAAGPTGAAEAQMPADAAELELVDGTRLAVTEFRLAAAEAACRTGAGPAKFDAQAVRRLRVAPRSTAEDDRWQQLSSTDAASDLLVVRKAGAVDFVEGAIGQVDAAAVSFTTDGDTLDVPVRKLVGLAFYRPRREPLPSLVARVQLGDGSRLMAAQLEVSEAALQVRTAAGLALAVDWRQVVRIEMAGGQAVFLSDLEPLEQKWTGWFVGDQQPLAAEFYRPRRDETFAGQPLTLDGREFTKGLALHSRTRLVYPLDGKFRRFKALAGIDPQAGGGGHVRLTVTADDRQLVAQDVAAGEPAQTLDLDVAGARRLTVLVDFGERLDAGDHLILGQARVTP